MKTPIYVECENKEIDSLINEIGELLREAEKKAAFLHHKGPMLYAVPTPDEDCISIGNIAVYGVSSLTDKQRQDLVTLLKSFTSLGE